MTVRNLQARLAALKTMPRPAFEKFRDQVRAEDMAHCRSAIAAGRGDWRPSDIRTYASNGDDPAIVAACRAYVEIMDAWVAIYAEESHRLRMHGCLRPWKSAY